MDNAACPVCRHPANDGHLASAPGGYCPYCPGSVCGGESAPPFSLAPDGWESEGFRLLLTRDEARESR